MLISKLLKVDRKKFFSYNHINAKHKRIDWTIRTLTIICLLSVHAIFIIRDETSWYWFLQPWFILIVYLFSAEIVRAIMERKYAENPNTYKVTVSELILILIILFTLFKTNFFGLI
ncbi:DUF4181 domain-containing protein [Niallia sp. BSM11]|uniref:DUF4181 domain-containing protein n=1 Tax=Niallia sp. BSM11 TaxID=3391576 RepID=UPI00398541D0